MEKTKTRPQIILTVGLPGCGKTTWAKQFIKKNPRFIRLNRDDLRRSIFPDDDEPNGYKFSKEKEDIVSFVQFSTAKEAINRGFSVIVDDTNLNPKTFNKWNDLATSEKVLLKKHDMTDIPLKVTLRRNQMRRYSVPENVIMKMYNSYINTAAETPAEYSHKEGLPYCIVFDIDGTLAHKKDRSPFDWNKVGNDEIDDVCCDLSRILRKYYHIVLLSGRDEICKEETEKWLYDNKIEYDYLYMRPQGNFEKDRIIKWNLLKKHVLLHYNVKCIFDDRQQVVDMWREKGIKCLQVAPGDF